MGFWAQCVQCLKKMEQVLSFDTKDGSKCCSRRCVEAYETAHTVKSPIPMPKPPTVQASRKQEADVAREMGGRQVRGSGAISGVDGDVKTAVDMVECKTTAARQITLHLDDWIKNLVEAERNGRKPSMRLRFNRPGTILPVVDLVVLDKQDYLDLLARSQAE